MNYYLGTRLFFLCVLATVFLISSGLFSQEPSLDDLLDLDLSDLMKIEVVSASKTLQKINEVPATVRIISAEQIQSNGYFTLEEALSNLPGFQFRNILGLNSYIFQRGVSSQNNLILVLIDGLQINELNSGGFYGGGQYNLTNAERIEVVYGPASALYGTNALSGIVNIITKSSIENQGLSIGALYGSFNTISTDASYGYYNGKNNFGLHLSAMYKTSEKADLSGAKGDNNWSEDMENFEDDYSINLKMKYKKLIAGINYLNKQSSATTYYKSTGTEYKDKGTLWNIRFVNTYLKYDYNLSQELLLSSKIYFRNTSVLDNSIQIINDTTQIGYYRPNNLFGFESLVNYKFGEQFNLTSGMVFESEHLASGYSKTYSASAEEKPINPPAPPIESNVLFSVYLQGQYLLIKPLSLTAGARFDNSSVYDQVLTPRMGIVYNKDRLTAKLLYMEAFRAPKPWDYNDGLGNPNLKPEEMKSLEFYTAYNISDQMRFDISVYSNILDERLAKQNIGNEWRWVNKGKLFTDGLETAIVFRSGKISAYLNYTYNDSYNEDKQQALEIAKHNANLGFNFSFNKNIKLNMRSNYLGKRKNPERINATKSEFVEDAFVFHSTLSFLNIHKFNFYLITKNIFNIEYYHTSNRSTIERYRQPQRTLILKTEIKF